MKCSSRSAPSGTKSSLVNIFTGSAMSVVTIPVFHGNTPKIAARLAPIRFWMSADPLRSTHSMKTVRCSTISNTTNALIAAIPISSPIRCLALDRRSRRSVARQALDQLQRAPRGQVLVVVVVHLHHRRRAAGGETLDFVERELAIRRGLAETHLQPLLDHPQDVVGSSQHARHV